MAQAVNHYGSAVNALSHVPIAQHSAIIDGTSTYDASAALSAAATEAAGRGLYIPGGLWRFGSGVPLPSNIDVFGDGPRTRVSALPGLTDGGDSEHHLFRVVNNSGVTIRNMMLDTSLMTSWTGGARCLWFDGASDIVVRDCAFKTCGAATAVVNSQRYKVINNVVDLSVTSGAAKHDGVIDQWWGSHDFQIRGNVIRANDLPFYGILVTGETTAEVGAACYDFDISENTVIGCKHVGIWVNGRAGINRDFTIHNNSVRDVSEYFGIGVSDAEFFNVTNNRIRNVARNGIRLYSEPAEGGVHSCRDGLVANNRVRAVNTTGQAGAEGAAILASNASTRNRIAANQVRGSAHTYGVYFSDTATANQTQSNDLLGHVTAATGQAGSGNTLN